VAPVLLGTAFAVADGGFHLAAFACALLGAVLIQVGTNLANDVADFERGADTAARKGPPRVTQAGLVTPAQVKRAAALAFGLAFLAGVYLIVRGGWPILALGLAAIASGVAYTAGRYALAYTGLADLFVLVFFGPVAVAGTHYVQTLALAPWAAVAGLGPGFLATAILLANNVRDVEEDRAADKRTLVVRFGRAFGVGLYAACVAGAALVPAALVLWARGHAGALAATLVAVLLGGPLARVLRGTADPAVLNPLLGKTARLLLVYSVAFGLGWLVGR
jgi:1,4-dihydroxy-2-naphthoate octaprenyltransferase